VHRKRKRTADDDGDYRPPRHQLPWGRHVRAQSPPLHSPVPETYRSLAPGTRPIADATLMSPADGTVLHFGAVQGARVEQVKGLTYSLDALLGVERPKSRTATPNGTPNMSTKVPFPTREMAIVDDREFANVNGIADWGIRADDSALPHSPHIRRRRRIGRRKSRCWQSAVSGPGPRIPHRSSGVQTTVATAVTAEVQRADQCVRRRIGPIRTRNGR
jgi:phosphatidylserine decarboxylase